MTTKQFIDHTWQRRSEIGHFVRRVVAGQDHREEGTSSGEITSFRDVRVDDLATVDIAVRLTCGVLDFSPQAFYRWRSSPVCSSDIPDAYLTNALVDLHADNPEFGYRGSWLTNLSTPVHQAANDAGGGCAMITSSGR